MGVYHYINGAGATAEADHFVKLIKPYIGKAIIVLDWEAGGNKAWGNMSYLDAMVKRVKQTTGITPMIYASASVFPWGTANNNGCSTWVAQYASYATTGYQATPWNEGAYTCDIRQYSSSGRLSGWSGNLDINKFYGDKAKWRKLAGQTTSINSNQAEPAKPAVTLEEWEMATKEEVAKATVDELMKRIVTAPKNCSTGKLSVNDLLAWNDENNVQIKKTVSDIKQELCEPYESNLDKTTGDLRTRVTYIDYRIQQLYGVLVPAMQEAIKALAESKGADGEAIALEVAKAVKEKLETISLEVKVEG